MHCFTVCCVILHACRRMHCFTVCCVILHACRRMHCFTVLCTLSNLVYADVHFNMASIHSRKKTSRKQNNTCHHCIAFFIWLVLNIDSRYSCWLECHLNRWKRWILPKCRLSIKGRTNRTHLYTNTWQRKPHFCDFLEEITHVKCKIGLWSSALPLITIYVCTTFNSNPFCTVHAMAQTRIHHETINGYEDIP